jgi:putative endonuclease
MMSKEYYVYIMTNKSRTLYTGVTNDLLRCVYEHKNKLIKGFTSKYNIQYLVYYETASSIYSAIEREKQSKGWLRAKKIALIESINPELEDLSGKFFEDREELECEFRNTKAEERLWRICEELTHKA